MENPVRKVVIVGAGHAGGTLAAVLRQYKFEGEVTLLGDEGHPPYQRPPLSKAWLMGDVQERDLFLKPLTYYADNRIDLQVCDPVSSINVDAQQAATASGRKFDYDVLVFATGARARTTEILDSGIDGIVTLRDIKDASALRERAKLAKHVVIVGGGYIGLEAASSIVKGGASVTIIEQSSRLLKRVASEAIAGVLQQRHESAGVRFCFNTTATSVGTSNGRVDNVVLKDGQKLSCDLLLVGMGVIANDQLAQAAGINCDGGILVDTQSVSSNPRVFAIGDVAVHCASRFGVSRRVESISNAVDQAKQVAAQIVGRPVPRLETPWFWSDQYELKVQMAGLPAAGGTVFTRTIADDDGTTVLHLSDHKLVGVETINRPRDFMVAKAAIARGQCLNLDVLSEADQPLSSALI